MKECVPDDQRKMGEGSTDDVQTNCTYKLNCTNKLGCACLCGAKYELLGLAKYVIDHVTGSYTCLEIDNKKRKRGSKGRWCSRRSLRRGSPTSPPPRRRRRGRRRRLSCTTPVLSCATTYVGGDGHHLSGEDRHGDAHDRDLQEGQGGVGDHVRGGSCGNVGGISEPNTHTGLPRTFSSPGIHSRKPTDWKLVRKRGIIPDGLVQTKLAHFIRKYPNLRTVQGERGPKRKLDDITHIENSNMKTLKLEFGGENELNVRGVSDTGRI